ncbi:carbohydrate sulfotransferase 11-like [Mya arenaria]|uniref:carbohydrate sulfotransferase 11-like n=1 Tax=Mya arenaria TaxID=6604 RepID=UPI0022E54185|nr:carbohydrate sulfotransferase 11-like [Mya arenaria]
MSIPNSWPLFVNIRVHSSKHFSHGYELAESVRQKCIAKGFLYKSNSAFLPRRIETTAGIIQLCPVWKAGTTFLKRLFMIKNIKKYNNLTNPYHISFLEEYDGERALVNNSNGVKRIMFVRNPWQRLYSCYVDKLLAPNPIYWKNTGITAIKTSRSNASMLSLRCGHDLSFSEFIKHVILVEKLGVRSFIERNHEEIEIFPDLHFEKSSMLCKPCELKYNFIGKMENFKVDSNELMKQMDLTRVAEFIESEGERFSVVDAIKDTLYQVFNENERTQFLKCITMNETLERVWQKLQMRGLIGKLELDLTDNDADLMTKDRFYNMVLRARDLSTQSERRSLKEHLYREIYATVNGEDLKSITEVYADDFDLYDYEKMPKNIF